MIQRFTCATQKLTIFCAYDQTKGQTQKQDISVWKEQNNSSVYVKGFYIKIETWGHIQYLQH